MKLQVVVTDANGNEQVLTIELTEDQWMYKFAGNLKEVAEHIRLSLPNLNVVVE